MTPKQIVLSKYPRAWSCGSSEFCRKISRANWVIHPDHNRDMLGTGYDARRAWADAAKRLSTRDGKE